MGKENPRGKLEVDQKVHLQTSSTRPTKTNWEAKMVKNMKNNKGKGNDMDANYNRKEQIKKVIFFCQTRQKLKMSKNEKKLT